MQRHPFFLRDLPPGVAEMNDRLVPPGAPSIKSFCMPEGVQARSSLPAVCVAPGVVVAAQLLLQRWTPDWRWCA